MNFHSAKLPQFLRPRAVPDLERLGRPGDGGYLLRRADIEAATGLLSFGVNDDWSFEEAVYRIRPMPIRAFDASVDFHRFRASARKMMLRRPRAAWDRLRTGMSFRTFFSDDRIHHKYFVGSKDEYNIRTLKTAIDLSGLAEPFMLKCDVEGAEWRILDDFVEFAPSLTCLVMEFHDVDVHLARLERFLASMPLTLVHTHPNNFSGLGLGDVPSVLELTMSASVPDGTDYVAKLPHSLDQPCRGNAPDWIIRFD